MFLVVRTHVNSRASLTKLGDTKERLETGEDGIATTGVFRELDWDYSGNLGLSASLSSSRLGCDSRRFHSETT